MRRRRRSEIFDESFVISGIFFSFFLSFCARGHLKEAPSSAVVQTKALFLASIKRMKPHEYPPFASLVPVSREPNKPWSLIRRSLSGRKGRLSRRHVTRRHKQNNKSCCGWGVGRRRAWISCPLLHRHCYSCHIPSHTTQQAVFSQRHTHARTTRSHNTGRLPAVQSEKKTRTI